MFLSGQLDFVPNFNRTLDWLLHRLVSLRASVLDPGEYEDDAGLQFLADLENGREKVAGFQGRPEKDPDVCYSFWIGASIRVTL